MTPINFDAERCSLTSLSFLVSIYYFNGQIVGKAQVDSSTIEFEPPSVVMQMPQVKNVQYLGAL